MQILWHRVVLRGSSVKLVANLRAAHPARTRAQMRRMRSNALQRRSITLTYAHPCVRVGGCVLCVPKLTARVFDRDASGSFLATRASALLRTARVFAGSDRRTVAANAPRTRVFSRVNRRKTRCACDGCTSHHHHAKTRGHNAVGDLAKTRVFRVWTLFRRVSRRVFQACETRLRHGVAKWRNTTYVCDTRAVRVISAS